MNETQKVIESYKTKVGKELGVTPDFILQQKDIDVFGAVTENLDPMHNDPVWALEEGPWGSTVAHGYFVLSLISKFWKEIGVPIYSTEEMYTVNYGLEKVRFISPFRTGIPGRASIRLKEMQQKADNQYLMVSEVVVSQDGSEKACMLAEILVLIVCS